MSCPHIGDHRMTRSRCLAVVLCSQTPRNASLIQTMTHKEEAERDRNIFATVTSSSGQPLLKISGKNCYKLKDPWVSSVLKLTECSEKNSSPS